MTMAFALFDSKRTKAMREAIEKLERAVEGKRAEEADAESRLRDSLEAAARMPMASAFTWKGRRDV